MSRNDREVWLTLLTFALDCGMRAINEPVFARSLIMQTFLPIVLIVAGLISIAIVVIFELRKTPKQETEMIEREDKAMSKLPDDPREMARWVP
jgi:hypothetical protein